MSESPRWQIMTPNVTPMVTISARIDLPGYLWDFRTAWPVADEPEPHRVVVARLLRQLADKVESGVPQRPPSQPGVVVHRDNDDAPLPDWFDPSIDTDTA